MASLQQNTMVNASENALPPYLQVGFAVPGCSWMFLCVHLIALYVLSCLAGKGKRVQILQLYNNLDVLEGVDHLCSHHEPPRHQHHECSCAHVWGLKSQLCCLQARGTKSGKGRLAMLKEDNARCCAPKTRIPTPAPKKKSRAVAVPAPPPSFVSKIPSPKSPSEMGGPPSMCTPEADHAAQASDERSDAGAAAVSEVTRHESVQVLIASTALNIRSAFQAFPLQQVNPSHSLLRSHLRTWHQDLTSSVRVRVCFQGTAIQLAQTPDLHALPTAEVRCTDASPGEAPGSGSARPYDDVPGQGTPQDFSSIMCNAGSPAGQCCSPQEKLHRLSETAFP